MHAQRIHYLVADAGHARWVVRQPGEQDLKTVLEVHADRDLHGGAARAAGASHRSSPPREGADERRRQAFADRAAALAAEEVAHGRCNRLVLVAPSRMLPLIRKSLPAQAQERVVGELRRDLTKTPDHELGRWLHAL